MKTFEVTSGALLVTDPCYQVPTWCTGRVENAKNGTWLAGIKVTDEGSWGSRVAEFIAWHAGSGLVGSDAIDDKLDADIGVDSGQCGVFDAKQYEKMGGGRGEYDDPTSFYGAICTGTLSDEHMGSVAFGAASSSGFGDGSYNAYVLRDAAGMAYAVKIVFIDEEYNDAEDEDDEDYNDAEDEDDDEGR